MSQSKADDSAIVVRNGSELEPDIRSALTSLLATEPTPTEVDLVLNRLRLFRDEVSPRSKNWSSNSDHLRSNRWQFVAASILVFCMCGIASSDVWAQVARDFSAPLNEPQPFSTLAENRANAVQHPVEMVYSLRLVLLAHVTLLTLGLIGMAITWIIAVVNCLLSHWTKSQSRVPSPSIQKRVLISSAMLYAVGMIFGAIWSQSIWGRPWSWAPRETFGLFTVAFAVLWLRSMNVQVHSETENWRGSSTSASIATIAQGAIMLMVVLGSQYDADLHSYGLRALTLPNLVFSLIAACLAVIWISFAARRKPNTTRDQALMQ